MQCGLDPAADLMPVCKNCEVGNYLIEEAQYRKEDFSTGIRAWHDQCKKKGCSCGCKRSERKSLLQRLRRSHHAH